MRRGPVAIILAALAVPAICLARAVPPSLLALAKSRALVSAVIGDEAFHPDEKVNPASVTKLFTAALALHRLGPERTFETSVAEAGDTLFVLGSGDPTLRTSDLRDLARCVKGHGVTGVRRVVFSNGPFNQESVPPAFESRATDQAYRAGVAGFQVDLNAIQVTVTSEGKVSVEPASLYVRVENELGQKKGRMAIRTEKDANGFLVVRVTGRSPRPLVTFRRVPDPALHAAHVFLAALGAEGITAPDRPQFGDWPKDAEVICTHRSPPVREVLRPMLKESLNPVAESLLRLAGAEGAKRPVGFSEGVEALRRYLTEVVRLDSASFSFRNGSGLYDANRISARAVVRFLDFVRTSPVGPVLIEALPVAGVDGTLKSRFKNTPLAGRVRAKTGTLDDAVSLAGFMKDREGREIPFAILVSRPKLNAQSARKAIDDALLFASGYVQQPGPRRPPQHKRALPPH